MLRVSWAVSFDRAHVIGFSHVVTSCSRDLSQVQRLTWHSLSTRESWWWDDDRCNHVMMSYCSIYWWHDHLPAYSLSYFENHPASTRLGKGSSMAVNDMHFHREAHSKSHNHQFGTKLGGGCQLQAWINESTVTHYYFLLPPIQFFLFSMSSVNRILQF